MRILTRADVQGLLDVSEVIDLMRTLFAEIGIGAVDMQQRTLIPLHDGKNSVLFMPGHVARLNNVGIKVVSVFPDNPGHNGRSTISATILLNDPQTGEVSAVMDGGYITALRTGAVSALATDLLAKKNAHRLAVFGAGVQARSQIDAIRKVRHITGVTVFDPDPSRALRLVEELRSDSSATCQFAVAASPDAAICEVDIIVTATTSPTPVFDGRLLKPGVHVNAIGSFKPEHREVDDDTIRRSRIFVDSLAEALSEAGDLIIPLRTGVIAPSAIEASLGDLVLGTRAARHDDDEITFFKSVGLAVEDIVVAAHVFEKAQAASIGTIVQARPLTRQSSS
jgi:ornithine cyclodeaminase